MQLLVFTVIGMCAMLIGFAFDLGGAVSSLFFLTLLFVGVVLRVTQPIRERLRP
jgi:hypothetical protein